MMDPRELGRPLDERERREFDRIVAAFGGPSAGAVDPWSGTGPWSVAGTTPGPSTPTVPVVPPPAPLGLTPVPVPGVVPPAGPAREGRAGHAPLTARQVLTVLVASAVFAALTATLPAPLNLWAPVFVLCVLAGACVVWGCRAERRRRR